MNTIYFSFNYNCFKKVDDNDDNGSRIVDSTR